MWENMVHVIHHRFFCKDCKSSFPTVDPDAAATLPTPVAEKFPFMLPNERGPGLYKPMLLMMVALMPSSILCGTFAKVINKLQQIKFA